MNFGKLGVIHSRTFYKLPPPSDTVHRFPNYPTTLYSILLYSKSISAISKTLHHFPPSFSILATTFPHFSSHSKPFQRFPKDSATFCHYLPLSFILQHFLVLQLTTVYIYYLCLLTFFFECNQIGTAKAS